MSRGTGDGREAAVPRLVREARHFTGLGATFFRAAAGRAGMSAADVQVVDLLAMGGPTTAGQLATLTGLTTGAIAQMLDRLEGSGLVRRERDPDDGRRVIVRLVAGDGTIGGLGPVFDSVERAWGDLLARYDEEQLAFLLAFLEGANAVARGEIARLTGTPTADAGGDFSAPLGSLGSGRLVVSSGAMSLALRGGTAAGELYHATFEGAVPEVRAEEGTVTIRYPRRLTLFNKPQRTANVALSAAVPWQIVVRGGASDIVANLAGLDLAGLDIEGGASLIRVRLPEPSGTVRVRITAGAADATIERPPGVAARVRLKGRTSALLFDGRASGELVSDTRLQSADYDDATRRYDIVVSGSASQFTVGVG